MQDLQHNYCQLNCALYFLKVKGSFIKVTPDFKIYSLTCSVKLADFLTHGTLLICATYYYSFHDKKVCLHIIIQSFWQ